MRRLVLFVEGEGEADAVPVLVRRLLNEHGDWLNDILLDTNPFRVGSIGKLAKDDFRDWKRLLQASLKRPSVGGVLLVLDGDIGKVGGQEFCASTVAKTLAAEAAKVGAGATFSVAIVFARQEYETWLIAGISSLAGQRLPDGRLIPTNTQPPGNLEEHPRDAKGWLHSVVEGGYKPTRDQTDFTRLVRLEAIRSQGLRSFRRLEAAISTLLIAIRSNQHIISPR